MTAGENTRREMMAQANLTMSVRTVGDTVSIVDVQGDVTAFAENALMDAYTRASAAGARALILNFSEMEYMNSGGIGLLVTLLIRINRQKQRLLTYGLSEHYRHLFDITRLNEAIGVYDTEAEALNAARASAQ
jgi:anti-sigma B factor antagonist